MRTFSTDSRRRSRAAPAQPGRGRDLATRRPPPRPGLSRTFDEGSPGFSPETASLSADAPTAEHPAVSADASRAPTASLRYRFGGSEQPMSAALRLPSVLRSVPVLRHPTPPTWAPDERAGQSAFGAGRFDVVRSSDRSPPLPPVDEPVPLTSESAENGGRALTLLRPFPLRKTVVDDKKSCCASGKNRSKAPQCL